MNVQKASVVHVVAVSAVEDSEGRVMGTHDGTMESINSR